MGYSGCGHNHKSTMILHIDEARYHGQMWPSHCGCTSAPNGGSLASLHMQHMCQPYSRMNEIIEVLLKCWMGQTMGPAWGIIKQVVNHLRMDNYGWFPYCTVLYLAFSNQFYNMGICHCTACKPGFELKNHFEEKLGKRKLCWKT